MKRSRFSEEQTLLALKQAEARQPVADVCRQMGISEATLYTWKKKYGNLGGLELRELPQLRKENSRLKRLVAHLTLWIGTYCKKSSKKDLAVSRRRDIAQWNHDCSQLSVRRSCRLMMKKGNVQHYRSRV